MIDDRTRAALIAAADLIQAERLLPIQVDGWLGITRTWLRQGRPLSSVGIEGRAVLLWLAHRAASEAARGVAMGQSPEGYLGVFRVIVRLAEVAGREVAQERRV